MSGKVASVGFSLSKLLLSWKLIAIGVDLLIKPQLLQNKIVLLQKVFLEKFFFYEKKIFKFRGRPRGCASAPSTNCWKVAIKNVLLDVF